MKKFKKVISVFCLVGVSLCFNGVKAAKFDCTDVLVNEIADSVMKSRCVTQMPVSKKRKCAKSRRGAGVGLCDRRIKLLESIHGNSGITDSMVSRVIGQYLRDGSVPSTSFEAGQLRQTANIDELKHNVAALLEAYRCAKKKI